ncbi:MAG: hypothetical protein QME49_04045 [bacterium]|nr:hypothetical protein [bacterium]
MINKTLSILIILISIICLYSRVALAKNGEDIPVNSGIIFAQSKMLDKGIEKTREAIVVSDNREIIQRFNGCCNARDRIADLIKDERFNHATLDKITETQKETKYIRGLIEQEIFAKKKLEKTEKSLSEKEPIIASSNNDKAKELFDSALKNVRLAKKLIKDNNITLANQYMDRSTRLLQQAVSFVNGREKIEKEIEYLIDKKLKKAEKIAQISKKEEVISMVNDAKYLVEKITRLMITYQTEDYEKVLEQINIASKLIDRAIRSSEVSIYEIGKLDMEQCFAQLRVNISESTAMKQWFVQWSAQLNEINKIIAQDNNPNAKNAKKLMDKAMKMAQKAEKAISSNDREAAIKYINSSYELARDALNSI